MPDAIKALRQSTERKLYDAQQTYRDVLPDPDFTFEGMTPDMTRAAMAETREMLADMNMSPPEVQSLSAITKQLQETPPSGEQRQAWRREAAQLLRTTYGDNAHLELDGVRKWIAQDPRRARILETNGLGDHPKVVALAVELARRNRNR